jgi:hypothetical protein
MTTTIDELFSAIQVVPDTDAEHHGIKGMKWGIRRKRGPAGTVSSNPGVSAKHLSDSDLREAVNRMQLERTFNQLSSERTAKGESFTKTLMKDIGKKQVKRIANSAVDIAVEQAIHKIGVKAESPGIQEVAKRMKPKKK